MILNLVRYLNFLDDAVFGIEHLLMGLREFIEINLIGFIFGFLRMVEFNPKHILVVPGD